MMPRRSAAPVPALVAASLLVGPFALAGCHRPSPDAPPSAADDANVEEAAAPPPIAPARCQPTGEATALLSEVDPEDLDLGDAVPTPGGFAMGLVRSKPGGRAAAVVLIARDPLRLTRIVELGQTPADATPPVVAWRGPDLVAAMCGVHGGIELTSISTIRCGPSTWPSRRAAACSCGAMPRARRAE
jgi:hypothetical protein